MASKYRVDVSQSAKQDMLDIARYISAELNTSESAMEMIDEFEDHMQSLDENPKRHRFARDDLLAVKGYRALPVKNYLVFYIVDDHARVVDIVRILYNRRNWIDLIY